MTTFWGQFERGCEWCGHAWRHGEERYLVNEDGLPGHETFACWACYSNIQAKDKL